MPTHGCLNKLIVKFNLKLISNENVSGFRSRFANYARESRKKRSLLELYRRRRFNMCENPEFFFPQEFQIAHKNVNRKSFDDLRELCISKELVTFSA